MDERRGAGHFRAANLMIKRYGKDGALDAAAARAGGANWP